ncbi:MAG: acyl-CoA dehydrogenase family protein [Rhodococcus sp. (in: high G+C Gram-positive bacteria)]|uniref:acyl-CoA dehydrogenase family protein n=1 Tax=Rhodococcus sp. TaxID=1831 RepID=UPI003BB16E2C
MTTIPGVDNDLSTMMHAVFAKHAATGEGSAGTPSAALWRNLTELGLSRLTGSAESGGSAAGWLEAAELLSAAAGAGVHIPLAEHDLLAGALLEAASLPVDDRLRTVAELDTAGVARAVPWASTAASIVTLWRCGDSWLIADVDTSAIGQIIHGTNLVGEPRDRVTADTGALRGAAIDDTLVEQYHLKSALARAIQVSAALDRAMMLSCEHATARTQFGRPLARFQAVQNLIADMAGECALARAATEAALAAAVRSEWSSDDLGFRVAVARSCAGHATTTVVRNAHQVHGAIGTALSHNLHRFTRAALAWRGEFGSVGYWDRRLAAAAAAAGPGGLWELIAS